MNRSLLLATALTVAPLAACSSDEAQTPTTVATSAHSNMGSTIISSTEADPEVWARRRVFNTDRTRSMKTLTPLYYAGHATTNTGHGR